MNGIRIAALPLRVAMAGAAALVWSLCAPAYAQAWPAKPVRIVVAWPPGGAVDVALRPLANRLTQWFNQSVVIENRAGAAGNVGAQTVARAGADGYTVLATVDMIASTPHLQKLDFDPMKDLVPVIQISRQPLVLAAHPSLGVGTLGELVELAKRKPGIAYASSGTGSNQHMMAEWFAKAAGIQLTHVPYKGGGQAIVDLVAGQVPLGLLGSTPLVPHYKAGKLRLLAQSSRLRSPTLADVPTFEEQGIKGLHIEQWVGLFVPAGTPAAVIERLNAEVGKALAEPAIRESYAAVAMEPVGGSQAEFAKLVREDYDKYRKVVKELGIRAD